MNLSPTSRRLPPRFAPLAFAFYMSGIVAFVMSLALTALNTGLDGGYMARALHGYLAAWPLGFLSVLAVRPLVIRLVAITVAAAPGRQEKGAPGDAAAGARARVRN